MRPRRERGLRAAVDALAYSWRPGLLAPDRDAFGTPGSFTISDNLVSNEPHVAENARRLGPAGGVYIGVGPEQNFSYIARVRPAMAFIVDIRRENRDLHLLYKALFEISPDRIAFVSRLFSRPRLTDLGPRASAAEIFNAFAGVSPSPELHSQTLALVRDRLLTTHRFPVTPDELESMARALKAFYTDGPEIRFYRSADVRAVQPTYRQLMTMRDGYAQEWSFLSDEDAFDTVKDLHLRNMIVPIVGDFGGPRRSAPRRRLRPAARRRRPGLLWIERPGLPDQPADLRVLRQPCRAARRAATLFHRTRRRAHADLEAEGLPDGFAVGSARVPLRPAGKTLEDGHVSKNRCRGRTSRS